MDFRLICKNFVIYLFLSLTWDGVTRTALGAPVKCSLQIIAENTRLVPALPANFWDPGAGALRKIKDGLALTVERRMLLRDANGKTIGDVSGRCKLAYDIWSENFLLADSFEKNSSIAKYAASQGGEALRRCVTLPFTNLDFESARVQILINPVDAQQEARTRDWLATKGIGGAGTGLMGRAMGAVINLKTESTVDYDCIK